MIPKIRLPFILPLFVFAACEPLKKDSRTLAISKEPKPADTVALREQPKSIPAKAISLNDAQRIAKHFAESFTASNNPSNFMILWNLPDSITSAFRVLRQEPSDQERYLTLVFARIYSTHLRCCHQSYDILRSNGPIDSIQEPLLYEFNRIGGFVDPHRTRTEFLSSGIAHTWIAQNPRLRKYAPIDKEWKIMQAVGDSIDKELYWKD